MDFFPSSFFFFNCSCVRPYSSTWKWRTESGHIYIYISPTESKQGQPDERWPNNYFFYWTKTERKLILIGCSIDLKRGKRKGRKKEK
jgi:hypothetical protein